MTLDVIMPVLIDNESLIEDCVVHLQRFTDVPFRVVVICDGGARGDWSVEYLLESYGVPYAIAHNPQPLYFNRCLWTAIPFVRNKFVALVPPEYRVVDEKWFGKMQQIFYKDPHAFIVDVSPATASTALTPVRRNIHTLTSGDTRFCLMSSASLRSMNAPPSEEDPVPWWGAKAISMGGNVWAAPGVNIHKVESKEHPTWREPSVPETSRYE